MPKKETKPRKLASFTRSLPWILIIAGIIGLICSLVLTLDEIQVLKNPAYQPACNINPVIACGSVMKSSQAHVFGLPNPMVGLGMFSILITVGVGLLAGAKFKKWFWLALNAGTFAGVVFVHWLFSQTLWSINALCPYCIVVWIVTITSFWYVSQHNLSLFYDKFTPKWQKAASFINRHHLDILILWFVVLAAIILQHFWYYYGKFL